MIYKSVFLRVILLPFGLLKSLLFFSNLFSRDFQNKLRFSKLLLDHGVIVDNQSILEPNVRLLQNAMVLNSKVASYSYIGRDSIIQNATIGRFCSIAPEVRIGLGTHPTDFISTSPLLYKQKNTFNLKVVDKDLFSDEYRKVEVSHDVWIGTRAIIMDGVTVGQGAIIAAGSIVTKDVPAYAIVGGVPAKILKYRFDSEKIQELLKIDFLVYTPFELAELNKSFYDSTNI